MRGKIHYHPALWLILCTALFFVDHDRAVADGKTTVGAVEEIVVLPWNIKLMARIDTGAATSSIDARDIRVKGNTVEFKLFEPGGGQAITLPLLGWRTIRTSEGDARRPTVRMQLCIGTQILSTTVNLNDRLKMEYALLIGRNALAGRFVVDVSQRNTIPPNCATGNAR